MHPPTHPTLNQRASFIPIKKAWLMAAIVVVSGWILYSMVSLQNYALDLDFDPPVNLDAESGESLLGSHLSHQDRTEASTRLDPNVKYLGFMPYGGLTNQFIALETAAYAALRLNRTLVLPPIVSNVHDEHNTHQRWSQFLDLAKFTLLTGVNVQEWDDLKPLAPEHVALGRRQSMLNSNLLKGNTLTDPEWAAATENLTCQIIYGYGGSEGLNKSEMTFAWHFLFRLVFQRPPLRGPLTPVYDRLQIGAKDNTDMADVVVMDDLVERYSAWKDPLLFLSHSFKIKDPQRRYWEAIGQHLHFLPNVVDYASQQVMHHISADKDAEALFLLPPSPADSYELEEPLPANTRVPYIGIHLRRGDIWKKCTAEARALGTCLTPLEQYSELVQKARIAQGTNLPVIVTTDSNDPEDHARIKHYGWHRLDHTQLSTMQDLGVFAPAMVDSVILAHSEVFIGTFLSTMSKIAAARQRSWYKHKTLYPDRTA